MQRTRAEKWYNETFMDTLEAATGIDFRNYVTHYEADMSLMECKRSISGTFSVL